MDCVFSACPVRAVTQGVCAPNVTLTPWTPGVAAAVIYLLGLLYPPQALSRPGTRGKGSSSYFELSVVRACPAFPRRVLPAVVRLSSPTGTVLRIPPSPPPTLVFRKDVESGSSQRTPTIPPPAVFMAPGFCPQGRPPAPCNVLVPFVAFRKIGSESRFLYQLLKAGSRLVQCLPGGVNPQAFPCC